MSFIWSAQGIRFSRVRPQIGFFLLRKDLFSLMRVQACSEIPSSTGTTICIVLVQTINSRSDLQSTFKVHCCHQCGVLSCKSKGAFKALLKKLLKKRVKWYPLIELGGRCIPPPCWPSQTCFCPIIPYVTSNIWRYRTYLVKKAQSCLLLPKFTHLDSVNTFKIN